MAFDQQALVDLFRQSFAPLVNVGASRLAFTQAQVEHEMQMRQHLGILAEQNRLEQERQIALEQARSGHEMELEHAREEAARTLEGIRGDNEVAARVGAQGATEQGRLKAQQDEQAFIAQENARKLAANLGLDVDPTDPNYVNKVTTEAGKVVAKHRQSANAIHSELSGLTDQLNKLADGVDVPEARQIQLAKPLLIAAATDPKKQAAYRKLATLDDIMNAAADEGASEKITGALQREQMLRNQTFEKKARPLQARQAQLQKTMSVLEAKGISPDPEALRANVAPTSAADDDEETGAGLSPHDVSNVFPAGPGAAPAAAARTPSHALETGAALTALAALPPVRAAAASFAGRAATSAGAKYAAARALGRFAATRAAGALTPVTAAVGAADLINNIPTFMGGEPLSASLAGMMVGSPGDEVARQKDYLGRLDTAIRQATVNGDFDTVRRLRSLRVAPNIDFSAIDSTMGQPASNPFTEASFSN